jgi:hypothetical protein
MKDLNTTLSRFAQFSSILAFVLVFHQTADAAQQKTAKPKTQQKTSKPKVQQKTPQSSVQRLAAELETINFEPINEECDL